MRVEPLAAAAVQVTTDWPLANEVAVGVPGGPGTFAAGTTAADGAEAAEVPAALVALTVNV